jgi:cytochrome c553
MEKYSSTRAVGKTLAGVWLVTVGLLFGSTAGSVQAAEGTDITSNCNECHGTDGLGFKPGVPHLNGQPDHLLTSMINAFQQGKRPTKVKMHRDIAAAEVAPLAKHYSQQKEAQRPKSATNPELVVRGEALYLKRCADCHVDNGRDSDKEAPLTAAQDLNYLVEQTLAFKTGVRKFPFLMDGAYKDLSDEDLTAVAHFFAAQEQEVPKKRRRR